MAFYDFPFSHYKFITAPATDKEGNSVTKVIAVSTYAGRSVRGVAICSIHDEFNLEKGKKLAAARCNAKVAKLRYKNSSRKMDYSYQLLNYIQKEHGKMVKYNMDALKALEEANAQLKELESQY